MGDHGPSGAACEVEIAEGGSEEHGRQQCDGDSLQHGVGRIVWVFHSGSRRVFSFLTATIDCGIKQEQNRTDVLCFEIKQTEVAILSDETDGYAA